MHRIADELLSRGWSRALAQRAHAAPLSSLSSTPLSTGEHTKYNVAKRLKALLLRDGDLAPFECGLSVEQAVRCEFLVPGASVPHDVMFLRDFNVSGGGGAAALAGNAPRLWDHAGDALRPASVLGRLGVLTVGGFSGTPVIPRFATAPDGEAAAEVGAASAGTATTAGHQLIPHRITTSMRLSRQGILQADAAASETIRRQLSRGLLAELERQFFNGTGTNDELTGLRAADGVAEVVCGSPDGGPLTHGKLCDLEAAVADDTESDLSAFAANGTTRRWLRTKAQAGTAAPFCWEPTDRPVLGHRAAVTGHLPGTLTKGSGTNLSAVAYSNDWSLALVAFFGEGVGITVDAFKFADTGEVRLVAHLFCDLAFLQPSAFSFCEDAATA